MHLREVTLRNWRSYRSTTFRFPAPSGRKRVILIGAMNGNGKTSLLMALYLGLFGREAMQYIEGVRLSTKDEEQSRSYRQLMKRILHRPALEAPDPNAFVELHFASADEQVTVSRTWYYRRGGDLRDPDSQEGEEIRIDHNGKVTSFRDWKDANNAIGDLLFPPHVAPCFFFDGEQVQARVEASGGRALSDAVTTLFGTGILNELCETLRMYVQQKQNQIRPESRGLRDDQLAEKRQRLDAIDAELSQIRRDLEKARRDHDQAEDARKAKTAELTQLVGDTTIDIKRIAQQRDDLRKRESDLNRNFQDGLTRLALPIALRKLGHRVLKQLDAEVVRDKWIIVREDATAKADSIVKRALPADGSDVEPPLTPPQREQLTARFRSALEMLWSPPPQGCASDYQYVFLSGSERSAVGNKVKAILRASGEDVARFATEWHSVRTRLTELNRKWDSVSDVGPKVEQVRRELNDLDAVAKGLASDRIRLETREKHLQKEAGELKGAIGQMEAKRRTLDPVNAKMDVAYRVREVIDSTRDRLIPLCRAAIQEKCTEHFREMISGEYRNFRVEFDDAYQPILVGGKGVPIYVTTLGGAQKRAFGLAFTLAVAHATGAEAPLVIDTPVGNMDSEYRTRILTYLAKAAPGQVIFLSHDEEISGEYAEQIRPYVVEEFLVDFERVGEGVGISTVTPDRYFDH